MIQNIRSEQLGGADGRCGSVYRFEEVDIGIMWRRIALIRVLVISSQVFHLE